MLRALAVIVAALPLLAPAVLRQPAVEPPGDPPAERVAVDLVTVHGSGCPAGTVGSSIPRATPG